ncbi:hypothetical protein SHJG_0455 [Streptomyces hygroscopicus subsp. jinggangensis 5008]|nr:hypothetical protein SHJG_0455 [Streptomyces hygroscopicus subsp. jinggangensis 5008]
MGWGGTGGTDATDPAAVRERIARAAGPDPETDGHGGRRRDGADTAA